MRNDEVHPMDIDIPEISTIGVSGNTPFNGLGLGHCTPFRLSEAPNLKKFMYDKTLGRIVQEHVKKVSVIRGNTISILIQTSITRNICEDPVSIASFESCFVNSIEDNVWNLQQQNLEKEARIMELEEKLHQVKIDEGNLQSFKAST